MSPSELVMTQQDNSLTNTNSTQLSPSSSIESHLLSILPTSDTIVTLDNDLTFTFVSLFESSVSLHSPLTTIKCSPLVV